MQRTPEQLAALARFRAEIHAKKSKRVEAVHATPVNVIDVDLRWHIESPEGKLIETMATRDAARARVKELKAEGTECKLVDARV